MTPGCHYLHGQIAAVMTSRVMKEFTTFIMVNPEEPPGRLLLKGGIVAVQQARHLPDGCIGSQEWFGMPREPPADHPINGDDPAG